jgi:DNA-binding NarL/FixJ family response regulator
MNIAIIGHNYIFRDSLRILLNQVADFKVVFYCDTILKLTDYQDLLSIDVALIDCCNSTADLSISLSKATELSSNLKFLLLTDTTWQYYWLNQKEFPVEGIIMKDSGKLEFEHSIRNLIRKIDS